MQMLQLVALRMEKNKSAHLFFTSVWPSDLEKSLIGNTFMSGAPEQSSTL